MDSGGGEQMDQFDPQQQMVYVSEDGNQYIYSADQAGTGEGMVSYIYGDDGTATAMAGDAQSSDSDVQYLLVSADEASSLTAQPQFVVMPPDVATATSMDTSGVDSANTSKVAGGSVVIRKQGSPVKSKTGAAATGTSASGSGEGTTAEVKVKGGGTAKVTILPSPSKSPGSSSVTTIPIRIVSRTDSSVVVSTQTISLPVKTSPKVSVSVKSASSSMTPAVVSLPKMSLTGSSESSPMKKAGRGRPRKDGSTKDPLHQLSSPGGVTKVGKVPNVIVVPIQISKEMIAAKQGQKAAASAASKSKESPAKSSPKAAGTSKVDAGKKGTDAIDEDKDNTKETPKTATKAKKAATPKSDSVESKSEQSSPEPMRRSKRESKLSVKLAEWGLVPSAGPRQAAADAAESDEDEEKAVKEAEVKPVKEVKEVKKEKKKKPVESTSEEEEDEEENLPLSKSVVSKSAAAATAALKKTLAAMSKESGSQTPSTSRQQPTPTTSVLKKPIVTKTPTSSKTPVSTTTKTIITASSAAKTTTPVSVSKVSAPASASGSTTKLLQNKSLMCKPIMMTKATSCNPIRITKATQTDEDSDTVDTEGGSKTILPVPVPIFLPAPMAMYNAPTPYPLPMPLPIPVPCFVPTTRNSIAAIMKQLKELHDSLPSDPAEADLLKMAEAVADATDDVDCASSAAKKGGEGSVDVLEMALRMASSPQDSEGKCGDKKANGVDSEEEPESKRQRIAVDGLEDDDDQPAPTQLFMDEPLRGPPPAPVIHAPIDDSQMRLKYSYGINAWKQWVAVKNVELEAAGSKRPKLFKSEILHCSADELSMALSLFVREVRKPTGQTYAADSVYYLCLGIQHYLFENGRVDNIFTDVYYERFTDALHELLSTHEVHLNAQGMIVCRVSEEHLWEARLLGAHSPRVLLNTLVYFNTKYFMLQTAENHLALSFSNILKQWKKNSTIDGKPIRSVYLRYNTVGFSPSQTGSQGGLDAAMQRRRVLDPTPFEQLENVENPLRCPVKLYEFYLSKCPESIRNRNDVFYLTPEPSCVPDSPVWYSAQPLAVEAMNKMLSRIRVVREIQETQLNQAPAGAPAAVAATVFG